MFAQVIPAVRAPRTLKGPFDYRIPMHFEGVITRGSTVIVPWRGKEVDALVLSISTHSDINAQSIKEISGLSPVAPTPEEYLTLLNWASTHYFTSPCTFVKAITPKTPKRKILREVTANITSHHTLSKKKEGKARLEHYNSPQMKYQTICTKAKKILNQKKSLIIIVPHSSDIEPMTRAIKNTTNESQIVHFHGSLNAGTLFLSWERILSGKPCVVIGTRIAVMTPLPQLDTIIITESESADLKQYDQNPRFDARTLALKRMEYSSCTTILMAHAPRTEDVVRIEKTNGVIEPFNKKEPETTLVSISGSPQKQDLPLPPPIFNATEKALHEAKKVLFFLNRRGDASCLICTDCQHIFRCETCAIALTVHAENLHCHRCAKKEHIPETCTSCKSVKLRRYGLGTKSLERNLREHFPHATIVRQDAESREHNEGDIIIGTQLVLHDIAEIAEGLPYGLIVGIDIDGLLAHTGFRTTEDGWRTIKTLKDIALHNNAPLMLTMTDSDDPAIRTLLLPVNIFHAKERHEREKLGYPPFASLIAIIAFGDTENNATKNAKAIIAPIKHIIKNDVTISGPLRPRTPFRHGKWRSVIALRARTIQPELLTYLASLPDQYVIDRDPEYLT